MIPWEGSLDFYADFCCSGGILANGFLDFWWKNGVISHQYNPENSLNEEELRGNRVEYPELVKAHPLRDEFWKRCNPELSKITVPFLSASNWFSAGQHSRGNFLAFQYAPSEHKRLEVHPGSHIEPFYSIQSRNLQKQFLGYWLKAEDTGLTQEPKVKLGIPTGGGGYYWRYAESYPLPETMWSRYYLDAETLNLSREQTPEHSTAFFEGDHDRESCSWPKPFMMKPFSMEANRKRLLFASLPLDRAVTLAGPMKLRLWASSSVHDLDVFVSLRNIDPGGNEVVYSGALTQNYPISQGFLRASLRKTDPCLSTESKPVYTFDEREELIPGKIYCLDIEIWDSAAVIAEGHSLVLEVGSISQSGCSMLSRTGDDRVWDADVTIYTGGEYDSYLLVPEIA
jgi:putative CocE/NonD family hydrolase